MRAAGLARCFSACLCACTLASSALAGEPPPLPEPHVDIERMYGPWHMIATIPNWFEKGLVEPTDVYSRRPDGDLQEDFTFRPGNFLAPPKHYTVHDWVVPGTNNSHWRVQIFWPINLPFHVLWVDPDYRYALFGEEDRKLGWIFAREPAIPEADYGVLLDRLAALGYDRSAFVKFVQTPDQIGKPGFWSEGIR